jgi:hypothetical protein
LATRAKKAASSRDDLSFDLRSATKTGLAFAAVGAMSLLVFAGLAFRVHEIRNRGAAVPDSMLEDAPNSCPKAGEFGLIQARSEPRGMNARLP